MENYYDDLPEDYGSWAESLQENVGMFVTAAKVVSIPTGLFILACIANYFINKKVESL